MDGILRILKPYIRGLPIIILAIMIGYHSAITYLDYATPLYESVVKLRLADVNEGVSSSNLFKDFDVFATSNRIAIEIEVIKSEIILNKVLNELDYDIEIFRKGKIKTVELYDQSPIKIEYDKAEKNMFDRLFDLQMISTSEFILTNLESDNIIQGQIGDTLILNDIKLIVTLNNDLLDENPHLKIIDNFQFRLCSRQYLIGAIKKQLDVIAVDKEVAVIRISYRTPHPIKTSKLVNKLAEVYIQDYIENKNKTAKITVKFLKEQIKLVFAKLSKAENDKQRFREKEGITNIRQETETDLRKIAQLKIQKTNLKLNMEAIRNLEQYIILGQDNFLDLAPNFEAFTDLLSTEIIKSLKVLQGEKRELLLIYTPENEKIKVVEAKIKDLTGYLSESITNTRKNIEIKYYQLDRDIDEAEQVFMDVPKLEKILVILNREFEIYQKSYTYLNEKKIEAEIVQAAKISFHRILMYGHIAKKPISPNRIIIILVTIVSSLFGAIMLIFIFIMIRGKLGNKHTIESNSLTPISMVVPFLKNEKEIENHFFKESIQLEIKGLLKQNSMLCFSSFSTRSGMPFIVRQLIKTLSDQGRKVFLIDADGGLKANKIKKQAYTTLNNQKYSQFTRDTMKKHIKKIKKKYDITIVLNQQINKPKSLMMMSLADTNFIVFDIRLSAIKRITEIDLLKNEYRLPNMHFILNRYNYHPNLLVQLVKLVKYYYKKYKSNV